MAGCRLTDGSACEKPHLLKSYWVQHQVLHAAQWALVDASRETETEWPSRQQCPLVGASGEAATEWPSRSRCPLSPMLTPCSAAKASTVARRKRRFRNATSRHRQLQKNIHQTYEPQSSRTHVRNSTEPRPNGSPGPSLLPRRPLATSPVGRMNTTDTGFCH